MGGMFSTVREALDSESVGSHHLPPTTQCIDASCLCNLCQPQVLADSHPAPVPPLCENLWPIVLFAYCCCSSHMALRDCMYDCVVSLRGWFRFILKEDLEQVLCCSKSAKEPPFLHWTLCFSLSVFDRELSSVWDAKNFCPLCSFSVCGIKKQD